MLLMIHVNLVGCRPLFKVQDFVGKNVSSGLIVWEFSKKLEITAEL